MNNKNILTILLEDYKNTFEIIYKYWNINGGWKSLISSPYTFVSILFLIFTWHTWTETRWWTQVISVMPNIIGFSIVGFAIFMSFSDIRFISVIAGNSNHKKDEQDEISPYIRMSSKFLHFILMGVLSLMFAILRAGLNFPMPLYMLHIEPVPDILFYIGNCFGYWMFLYAICLAAGTGFALFRISTWYDKYITNTKK